jgi:3',5'-cyclic AMP phosphodiesterase CpdA
MPMLRRESLLRQKTVESKVWSVRLAAQLRCLHDAIALRPHSSTIAIEQDMTDQTFDPLQHLKRHQTRFIPGTHDKPFLDEPAEFQSTRDADDIAASQIAQLVAIPKPARDPPILDLAHVIGSSHVNEIVRSGQIVLHAVGDTGNPKQSDLGEVVPVMSRDFHRPNPADHPAIFLHLGDVCYNYYSDQTKQVIPAPKSWFYKTQFYEPYANYPGKIIAIPGNHDSDPEEDPHSIEAFQANFCAPLPTTAAELDQLIRSTTRTPMYQPGVYYRFDAPFVQVIALFSNGGEIAGVIRNSSRVNVGNDQWDFLVSQLGAIKKERDADPSARRCLVLAVHHPPFSGGGGHAGSSQMLADLDHAFAQEGIIPDLILSGHAHCYQRFTRSVNESSSHAIDVPFIVAGNGGHAITPVKFDRHGKPIEGPLEGTPTNGTTVSLRQYFNGYGHLYITVTKQIVTVDLIGTHASRTTPVDSVTLDLNTRRITHETPAFAHPAWGEKEKHVPTVFDRP